VIDKDESGLDGWAGGIHISDIALFPSVRSGFLSGFSGGIDIFDWQYDDKVRANDGINDQINNLEFATLVAVPTLKYSFLSGGLKPYIGIGAGPAWTRLLVKRTTTLALMEPNLEKDRAWDTSNLAEAFGGCDVYMGGHFHFTIEVRWLTLSNKHLVFPDAVTDHHTAEVKSSVEGWMSLFSIGIRF